MTVEQRSENPPKGKGRLKLHGAWFDIADGQLWVMAAKAGDFERLPEDSD